MRRRPSPSPARLRFHDHEPRLAKARRMGMDPGRFFVDVDRGVVTLEGCCERRGLIPILVRLVYGVDGVVHVDERLSWDIDDTLPRRPQFSYLGP